MNNPYLLLYDYNIWANNRLISHLGSLPEEIFSKEVNLGFKSIAEVITHLISADQLWLTRITEGSPSITAPTIFSDIEEAGKHINILQSQFREHLITIDDFEKKVAYRNKNGQERQNSVSEIIQQVVNHGTYHRGNISTMLRYLGYKGVLTDYIAFIYEKDGEPIL
ncbi:DinB family protein [Paenibacillus sp. J22TS3]|uniref:DinB family protein n=1 Tax=Paenibacillus sp. J22TS3 TaxID=2807192 RepID=UPI001B004EA3|nr:DinB family protein [Paenibacillus sp. J22TS3]GIP22111.1 hypothetical protein J22TS3_23860 [Paenibacillus sp. J22TS3]